MKSKLITTAITLFLLPSALFLLQCKAAVFTVSNAAGGGAQYTQIDAAISAATAGDTIYVKGTSPVVSNSSSTMYNSATITKSLTLIGSGTFAQKQIALISFVNALTISSNINGVTIKGFAFYNGIDLSNKTSISNITINENYFFVGGINMAGASNLSYLNIADNNLSTANIDFTTSTTCFNLIISNNLISGHLNGMQFSNANVQNNVFYYPNNGGNVCGGSNSGVVFKNNIYYNANASANTLACTFLNNITYHATITYPTLGASNYDNTNPLFVNSPTSNQYSTIYNFNLQPASQGINAGADATDIGYFGGGVNITLTGEPQNVPILRQMDVLNGNIPLNGNVTVKVKSTKAR